MHNSGTNNTKVREAVFAGRFYPSSGRTLAKQLTDLFAHAENAAKSFQPQALIAPHAGYVYSGRVAASAYNQLPVYSHYKRVFIIASSHQYTFHGASTGNYEKYKTPLGEIHVDFDIIRKLNDSCSIFSFFPEAHQYEHSLEVQLPFLQQKLGNKFSLVPIIIGTQNKSECENIALLLEPWFIPENLFVISTDFSHYPEYEDAMEIDNQTANAICSNDPEILLKSLGRKTNIGNLATPLCGWTSVLTLMNITKNKNIEYRLIHYQNSGDSENYGDKGRVVGYWAIAVFPKQNNIYLSPDDRKALLNNARNAIVHFVETGSMFQPLLIPDENPDTPGIFVSIYVNSELRGCIGRVSNKNTLTDSVQQLAVSACCDLRFENISMKDLDYLEIEISVLSPLRKIKSIDEIILGLHGVYIIKGAATGIFLPQVASKTGWTLEEFLGHCARDKAGLGWYGWKDAEIYIYETFVFRD